MNYLAHIHLAHTNQSSKLGNFLGDFVKGSQLDNYPAAIEHGIRLHRSIDKFTDNHPAVLQLRAHFPKSLRRMSGVVIDVYFDHLLCKFWQDFTDHNMENVIAEFYQELSETKLEISPRFAKVRQGLLDYQWLSDYQDYAAVVRAYKQIEARLNHRVSFAEDADALLEQHHPHFENAFLKLYPDLIKLVSGS